MFNVREEDKLLRSTFWACVLPGFLSSEERKITVGHLRSVRLTVSFFSSVFLEREKR